MHNTVSKLTVKGCVMPLGKEQAALCCSQRAPFQPARSIYWKSSPVQLSYQRWFTEIQGIQALIDQYPSFKKPAGVIKSKKKIKLNKSQGFFAVGKAKAKCPLPKSLRMFYLWQSIAFRGIASMCLKAGQELGFQGKYGFVNEAKGTGTGKAAWINTMHGTTAAKTALQVRTFKA